MLYEPETSVQSSSLHPPRRVPATGVRQAAPMQPPRPVTVMPPPGLVQVHRPFLAGQAPPQPGLPQQRVVERVPVRGTSSLLAARKAATQAATQAASAVCATANGANGAIGAMGVHNGAAPPTVGALLGPRLDHVEALLKEACENIAVVDRAQSDQEKNQNGSWILADVVVDTVEFVSDEDDHEKVMNDVAPNLVKSGVSVSLSYPMVESRIDGQAVLLMRRRSIDSTTAEITASWLVIHTPGSPELAEADVAHVTNFRF